MTTIRQDPGRCVRHTTHPSCLRSGHAVKRRLEPTSKTRVPVRGESSPGTKPRRGRSRPGWPLVFCAVVALMARVAATTLVPADLGELTRDAGAISVVA